MFYGNHIYRVAYFLHTMSHRVK